MKHIHLIPADFEYFNFDDFINESDGDENGVCWKNGGNAAGSLDCCPGYP